MNPIFDFLDRLALNNNRPWFAKHKAEFDHCRALWFDQLQTMINCMAQADPALGRYDARDCTYRIYRDTRFSPDKTPYKVYFSAAVSEYGRKTDHAGYYLQMDIRPGESGLFGGVWCPEAPLLRKVRKAFVDNEEEIRDILSDARLNKLYPGWCGRSLKTIPKGYDRDHPCADLLRLCDIGKFHPLDRTFFDDPEWPVKAAEEFLVLKPFIDFLNYSIDE